MATGPDLLSLICTVYVYVKEGIKSCSILYPAVIAVSLTHYLNVHSISKLVSLCLVK